jgi:glycosyltransferase involved in cell wall biosynthesis
MKLIHVFSAPQSAFFFMNGQLDYMASKGIEVTVIIPIDLEFNVKLKEKQPNIKIININFERTISIKTDIICLLRLVNVFRKEKPDIIHLHTLKASFLGALAARFLLKKNIIYQMHGLVSASGNDVHKGLLYYMEKLTCNLSTHIFAVSKSLKEFAVAHKFCKQNKISVIGNGTINGIDFQKQFNPENIQRTNAVINKLATEKFVIGFVGRLVNDKGIDDYLKILTKCKENELSTVGVIIGPDESKGYFSTLLKKHDLIINEDIIVLGQQLEPQNFMIYFDVLLLPTKREGFGLVGAEANALKIPVVGYDIPGFRDAVKNNETGLLVKFEDTHELYDAIIKYFKSADLKRQHGNNGRKRVIRDFNSEHIWHALLLQYSSIVDEKGFKV